MKKLLKFLAGTTIGLVLIVILAIIIVPLVVDPNDYREEIANIVKDKTGRTLSIEGDISLSVFPWLGVTTGKLTVSQPEGISEEPFVSVDAADIKVKVWPLLFGNTEVDTVVLKQPVINWVVESEALDSLTGLTGDESATEEPADTADSTSSESDSEFSIAGINVVNGQLSYNDKTSDSLYKVTQLNVQTGNLLSGKLVNASVSGELTDSQQVTTAFSLNTKATFDQASSAVSMSDIAFDIKQVGKSVAGSIEALTANEALVELKAIVVNANPGTLPISMKTDSVAVDLVDSKAVINSTSITTSDINATISNLIVKDWDKTLVYSAAISTNTFNAQKLLKALDVDYQPAKSSAMSKLALKTNISGSADGISAKAVAFTLDESLLKGDFALTNFSQPSTRFDLNLNKINLDHYLPKESQTSAEQNSSGDTGEALAIPMAIFKTLNANGAISIGQLIASNITLDNVSVAVASSNNQVTISPKASLYKGSLSGNIIYKDAANDTLTINTTLSKVDLGPLLKAADVTDQVEGRGTIKTNLVATQLKNQQSKQGTIAINIADGMIKGFDIKKILDDTQNRFDKLRGKEVKDTATSEKDQTGFSNLSATMKVNNDIVTNDDLSIKAPAFRIAGKGKINIAAQTVDYLTSVSVVKTNSGQGGANRDKLKGVTIPIRFKGPITNPNYSVDMKALVKANLQQEIDAEKDRALNALSKKLGVETSGESRKEKKKELENNAKEKAKKELGRGLESLLKR